MSKIKTLLAKMGLTDTEIKIYLIGLSYESISVRELEKKSRINRTTIYHALGTLSQKGLVAKRESGTGAKHIFTMTSPVNLKKYLDQEIYTLEEQKKEIDMIIPLLTDHLMQKEDAFTVSHFEGINGIKLVVEEALYCRSHTWDIIAPKQNFFSDFDRTYAQYYLKTRKNNRISARSLWESLPPKKALTEDDMINRNPRLLPKNMHGKFRSVIILFDDKVAFISSIKNLSAILIHSAEIHDTMSAIFEGLWQNAKCMHK